MSKTDNLTDFLTGVANAIRTKKGTTAKINPQNFETEISSITTSKPEQEKTVEPTNSRQTILPDYEKTLSKVIVEAAPLPNASNPTYENINKCLIDKKNKILILGCNDSVIPSDGSVTSIGKHAFEWCSELASITIPNSVTSIGGWAFSGCIGLKSIYYIGDVASWCGIEGLENVTSYSRALYIGGKKVEGELVIPDSVTSISSYAFSYCSGLTSITIPDSVTSIGYQTFYKCSGLTSIIIPNSVTSIIFNAFGGCSGIESLVVTTGNKKYHSANNCIIETETKELIAGCKTSVIPSDGSVTSIGLAAFLGCSGLTNITIPDSVTLIDSEAFRECTSLTSVIIPDSVTSIDINAFFYCIGLTSVTIGNSVTSIGWDAFQQCTSLTNVTMLPTNPPTLGSNAIPSNVTTITVPVGCGDAYKTAEGWSVYADKIVEATA